MKTATLSFLAEKKHSVRYDTKDPDAFVQSIYIRKAALTTPYPADVKITMEEVR